MSQFLTKKKKKLVSHLHIESQYKRILPHTGSIL